MTTNNVLAFTRPTPSGPPHAKPAPLRLLRPPFEPPRPAEVCAPTPEPDHFAAAHPLAEVVRRRCRELDHSALPGRHVGPVGCGQCWEAAIRADERFVVEYDLDDAAPVPADDLDEIALERAMRGERVPLTEYERTIAIHRLRAAGLTVHQIAKRLHVGAARVGAVLNPDLPSAALAA